MPKPLTTRFVEQVKPDRSKRREIPDAGSGLYFVVQPSGARSWAVRYRFDGKPRKLTIGSYPRVSLADARKKLRETLEAVDNGADPAAAKSAARQAARHGIPQADLFVQVSEVFIRRYVAKNAKQTYADEVQRLLAKEVLPVWGHRRVQDISKRDVVDLLDGIVDRGGGLTANRVLAAIRRLFNWAVERDVIAVSPCVSVKPPVAEPTRDRILSEDELRWLWRACDRDGFPFGSLVKMLLLTGQRRNEVAGMVEGELDQDHQLWTIPGARTKNGEEHTVPLSETVMELIASLPRIEAMRGAPAYLFTTNGRTHVSGYSRGKARLDRLMREQAVAEVAHDGADPSSVEIPRWTLHDLRRTAASGMARLGVGLPVIEKVLNHKSGSFAGIVDVYQRHEFAEEKREALEAWANHLSQLTSGREHPVGR